MSIKEKIINGKKVFQVYAWIASKKIPGLRMQKRRYINSSKGEALRLEKQLILELAVELAKEESRGERWCDLCTLWKDEFLNKQKNVFAAETVLDNFSALRIWGKSFWEKPASEIKTLDIRVMLKEMNDDGKTKGYQSRVKYAFNTIYSWGIETNIIKGIDKSPAYGISIFRKEIKKREEVLNKEEIKKLLQSASELDHPWFPIWFLALSTGARNGELHALRFIDLDFTAHEGQGNIIIRRSYNTRRREDKTTKSGYWRNVPMNSSLREFLLELKNSAGSREHVLPRMKDWDRGDQSKILRKFCYSIGVSSVRFHALRASFATQMLQNNVAPATIMKIGGWSDLDTMGIYLKLAGVDERGATECLSIIKPARAMENILPFTS